MASGVYYVAGIDSGTTSTDVVILDQDGKIKSTMIIPTGGGANHERGEEPGAGRGESGN